MRKPIFAIWGFMQPLGMNKGQREHLLRLFDKHNEAYSKLIGHGRSRKSYQRYDIVYKHLRAFLKKRGQEHLPVRSISSSLIREFEQYLRVDAGLKNNTVWVYMIALKHVLSLALASGSIRTDPFAGFRNRFEQVERGYLTEEELKRLMQYPLNPGTPRLVRDLFVFAAFTGMSYADIKALKWDSVRNLFDGNTWIVMRRIKTNTPSNILLLSIPRQILSRYGDAGAQRVFRVPSNNCCNKHLIQLGKDCEIPTRITFHIARHTFATLSLSNGVPVETLSSVLGHTSIRTTQIYAKITNRKISEDMTQLANKLHHFHVPE